MQVVQLQYKHRRYFFSSQHTQCSSRSSFCFPPLLLIFVVPYESWQLFQSFMVYYGLLIVLNVFYCSIRFLTIPQNFLQFLTVHYSSLYSLQFLAAPYKYKGFLTVPYHSLQSLTVPSVFLTIPFTSSWSFTVP